MAGIARFEELELWQASRKLAVGVYRAARNEALRDDPPLRNQIKRSAISISSNIAEGFERGTRQQQIEFCYIARGSASEVRSQVRIAADVGLLSDEARDWLLEQCEICSKLLYGYIEHLKRSKRQIPGPTRKPATPYTLHPTPTPAQTDAT